MLVRDGLVAPILHALHVDAVSGKAIVILAKIAEVRAQLCIQHHVCPQILASIHWLTAFQDV